MPSCAAGSAMMPKIDFAVAQPLQQGFGLVLVQHETQVGQRLAKLRHHPRQQIGADRGNQRHLELAGERIGIVAGERDDFLAFTQHAARAHHHLLAHLGELHVLRLALHQFDAEILLELLHLGRQGWLAHEGTLGRLAEMAGIGERHQILQILEIHAVPFAHR